MGMRLRWTDTALPAAVLVLGVAEYVSLGEPWAAGGIVLAVCCVLLVVRRRWPLLVCTAVGVLQALLPWLGQAYDEAATLIVVLVIAVYALGRWVADLRGVAGLAVVLLTTLVGYVAVDQRDKGLDDVIFVLGLLVPPYVFGRITRRLADHNALLEQRQELVRQAAVRDERDRIAREVHDVIAHSVSAMVVQVAAARDLVRSSPERAEELLDRVAGTGRTAIAETSRLLHVLRDTDDELGLAPTPGLGDLDTLVAAFGEDGLAVDLVVDGLPDELPAAVDVSAYRIVREALTNALRYSADRTVRLELLGTATGLTVRTLNPTGGATGAGSGLGLGGLAERVRLLGGTLHHGLTSSGGFELVATLPVAEREPA